jgi:hypothetical protein
MMFTDKPLRLTSEILGVESIDDRQVASSIPIGTIVYMVEEPTHDPVSRVDIRWNSRVFTVFATDLERCSAVVGSVRDSRVTE